ncbi:MAG: DNA alkylation repair protein, partial [Candidatus Marinimicrobia bacterium CG_4_9_14_3_um_filter_48_9]
GIAGGSVGRLLLKDKSLESYLVKWSNSENFWMRRSAIIGQLKLKRQTNAELLFGFCGKMAHEKEFFIRKAIGWALREYAKTNPNAVKHFVENMGEKLSGLSRREALKHLN